MAAQLTDKADDPIRKADEALAKLIETRLEQDDACSRVAAVQVRANVRT